MADGGLEVGVVLGGKKLRHRIVILTARDELSNITVADTS
jgi:hypothetical protein